MEAMDEDRIFRIRRNLSDAGCSASQIVQFLELEEQRKIVMQASQEVKSIDKLEEKQLEEYQLEASRAENEERMEMLTMTK